MSQINLFYAGQPGEGFGWGTCNKYLIRELGKLCNVFLGDEPIKFQSPFDGPVFMPIADHDLNPLSRIRGKLNLGYTFFEFPLGPHARENAKRYGLIFTGSTWCKERLAEIGVHNTEVLIQGVDAEIFKPEPRRRYDDEIRLFSGGKFEYRKGQDLVLAAFKLLHEKYPKLRLVTCWHNLWPGLVSSMQESKWIKVPTWSYPHQSCWNEFMKALVQLNGIPKEKVYLIPPGDSEAMAFCYNQCDLGVFPNRCEGGTNLVMMEFAACGKPIVGVNGTGHADIFHDLPRAFYPPSQTTPNKWEETSPVFIANAIEDLMGADLVNDVKPYRRPWSEPAKQIVAAIERLS